jgi:non-specific serine/threonine protein kinase/serine/threonine-protein kinase
MNGNPRLPDLFAQASELDGDARVAWLADLRREDEPLAREIEELLAAADAGERFSTPAADLLAAPTPAQVGPYRIRREIGRGGMGRVFLAEQEEAAFRRTVALKIIDRPGASEHTIRRFSDEVRILASLEHASIARFFDGGRTPDGTWFLALEFVDGEDLLTYVTRQGLDLRARIELFVQVVDAVDFAHRRLIVHRDLKPGNVLVGPDGRPKLLDFGIAKVLDPLADRDGTQTEMRALTPAYASPEQQRGERVTVASDVYSLGVMLYEILTGARPSVPDAPRLPSAAVRESPASVDATPGTTIPVRWRDLTGDLDAIALKALRVEPESRYGSAAALADDLRGWLAGEPVKARRGGRRYRVGKFVARHRVAIAAAAAIVVALSAGVSVALVQRSRAMAARARAEATVADLHRLTQSMLFDVFDDVRRIPNSLNVSAAIVRQSTEVLDRLTAGGVDDPRLLADLAAGYARLGAVHTSHPALSRSLNRPKAAVEYYERAMNLRAGLASRPGAAFEERLAFATSLGDVAQARMNARDTEGSVKASDEAIDRLQALEAAAPDKGFVRYRRAVAHTRAWLLAQRAPALAPSVERHAAAASPLWLEVGAAPPPSAIADLEFATVAGVYATRLLLRGGRPDAALRLNDLAFESLDRRTARARDTWAAAHTRATVLDTRIDVLRRLARPAEALAVCKDMLRLRATLQSDADDALVRAIATIDDGQEAAVLGVEAGDLEFAQTSLANAVTRIDEAERRWGARAFGSMRIEVEWTSGRVLEARAAGTVSPRERRRLLAAALAAYETVLDHVARLGGAGRVHGMTADRLERFRSDRDRVAALVRH